MASGPAAEQVITNEPVRQFVRGQKIDLSTKAALITKKPAIVSQSDEEVKKRDCAITEEALFARWMRFPSRIKDMYGLHFIFTRAPKWDNESRTITIEASGELIAKGLTSVLKQLTQYMRDGLSNDSVKIEIHVSETKQDARDLSPKGKAAAMAKKNDKLRDLFRRLNLDFT